MTDVAISPRRRREIIDALRRGTVPQQGLDVMAVGLGKFETAIDEELDAVKQGAAQFKAVRGEYGSGKTFFSRWLVERAKKRDFATAEIQISETETPLHKLEKVYRRIVENLSTPGVPTGALSDVVDGWFYVLGQDVRPRVPLTPLHVERRTDELLEKRLAAVSQGGARVRDGTARVPAGERDRAERRGRRAAGLARGPAARLGRRTPVGRRARRARPLRCAGLPPRAADGAARLGLRGLVLVLDEVETLQRMRSDVREKSLNALRQLMDEIDSGRFPGLYLLMTGTPAFYDGQQGVQRLAPLAQRLQTDFATDARFDNPRAPQIRLHGFTSESLVELGSRVRDIYAAGAGPRAHPHRRRRRLHLRPGRRRSRESWAGKTGVAPRVFLKKLVADVLDRVDQFPDFDPRQDYALTVSVGELTDVEREARARGDLRAAASVDDVDLGF